MVLVSAVIGIIAGIAALIGGILGLTNDIIKHENRKKKEKLIEENRAVSKPTIPPHYFLTIEQRNKELKDDHPYSTKNIKKLLVSDVEIPPGYALSQLQHVGFAREVARYKVLIEERSKDLRETLSINMGTIIQLFKDRLESSSEKERLILQRSGIGFPELKKLEDIRDKLDRGEIEGVAAFQILFDQFKTLQQNFGIQSSAFEQEELLNESIKEALSKRDLRIQSIVDRTIRSDLNLPPI